MSCRNVSRQQTGRSTRTDPSPIGVALWEGVPPPDRSNFKSAVLQSIRSQNAFNAINGLTVLRSLQGGTSVFFRGEGWDTNEDYLYKVVEATEGEQNEASVANKVHQALLTKFGEEAAKLIIDFPFKPLPFRFNETKYQVLIVPSIPGGDVVAGQRWLNEQVMKDIAKAMFLLHAAGFVHRDLKFRNVMFRDRFHKRVVLIDLGFVAPIGSEAPACTGTIGYMTQRQQAHCDARSAARLTVSTFEDLVAFAKMCRQLDYMGHSNLERRCRSLLALEQRWRSTEGVPPAETVAFLQEWSGFSQLKSTGTKPSPKPKPKLQRKQGIRMRDEVAYRQAHPEQFRFH